MNADQQVNLRLSSEEKELLKQRAKEHNMTDSEYLRTLINKGDYSITLEQQIKNASQEMKFINNLLTNPKMPQNAKQIITKEIKNYVRL